MGRQHRAEKIFRAKTPKDSQVTHPLVAGLGAPPAAAAPCRWAGLGASVVCCLSGPKLSRKRRIFRFRRERRRFPDATAAGGTIRGAGGSKLLQVHSSRGSRGESTSVHRSLEANSSIKS